MPLDKVTHLLAGAVIALALGYVLPVDFGLLAVAVIGAGKEIYDSFHPDEHTADSMDFAATLFGGLIASLFIILVT